MGLTFSLGRYGTSIFNLVKFATGIRQYCAVAEPNRRVASHVVYFVDHDRLATYGFQSRLDLFYCATRAANSLFRASLLTAYQVRRSLLVIFVANVVFFAVGGNRFQVG